MIVVTGAAGFIGSHVADFYSKQGKKLLLVDTPAFFRERAYGFTGDASLWDWATGNENGSFAHKIIDRQYFLKVLHSIHPERPTTSASHSKEAVLIPPGEKIEAIIHMGACTDTAETRKDYLNEWNFDYTKSIWNWCSKHNVPLIYASSGATYGGGEQGFSDSWETSLQLKPLNPYGQSKQDFDLWVHENLGKETPPHWYGLKFFNVYGPHEGHKGSMASAVLHSYRHIKKTGRCRLFRSHRPEVKDGEQSRDFIYVSDIVSLIDFFLREQPDSGLYNCGTGKARTFYSMMEALFSAMGLPMEVDWIDTPEQYRKAYQYFTQAEMSHTLSAGYGKPFIPLEEGVKSYVGWLEEQDRQGKE